MSDPLAALVDEIGRAHGVAFECTADTFALDYDGGSTLEIETVDGGQAIRLSTALCTVVPTEADVVLAFALRANMNPAETGAGWISLDPELPVLRLSERHELDALDAQTLSEVLAGIIMRIRALRRRLAGAEPDAGLGSADPEPASRPKPSDIAPMIRV